MKRWEVPGYEVRTGDASRAFRCLLSAGCLSYVSLRTTPPAACPGGVGQKPPVPVPLPVARMALQARTADATRGHEPRPGQTDGRLQPPCYEKISECALLHRTRTESTYIALMSPETLNGNSQHAVRSRQHRRNPTGLLKLVQQHEGTLLAFGSMKG